MTVEIRVASLWTSSPESSDERVSLAHLSDENTHVHGLLEIDINGQVMQSLGYFGPDDVCFNDWVRELAEAARVLGATNPGLHVFDEGEEGQPAFHFERQGALVFVSVRDSALSGASGDPTWQRVPCELSEFVEAVSHFLDHVREILDAEAGPARAQDWWLQFAKPPNSGLQQTPSSRSLGRRS